MCNINSFLFSHTEIVLWFGQFYRWSWTQDFSRPERSRSETRLGFKSMSLITLSWGKPVNGSVLEENNVIFNRYISPERSTLMRGWEGKENIVDSVSERLQKLKFDTFRLFSVLDVSRKWTTLFAINKLLVKMQKGGNGVYICTQTRLTDATMLLI